MTPASPERWSLSDNRTLDSAMGFWDAVQLSIVCQMAAVEVTGEIVAELVEGSQTNSKLSS